MPLDGYILGLKSNKMKDLILIGGAKGVGKSTVISEIKKITKINVVNTGEICINAIKNKLNPEEEIRNYLIKHHYGIVDTHYTGGYSNKGFSRGLSKEYLLDIAESKSIDLILLDLDEESLFKRRYGSKEKKYQDREAIRKELEMNRYYFEQYCKDLLISGFTILNTEVKKTVDAIWGRIK